MALVKTDRLPAWATWVYEDMKSGRGREYLGDPAMLGDGLVLLAPVEIDDGFRGLMLAEGRVSGQEVDVTWRETLYRVRVPEFSGFLFAKDGADLDLVMLPPAERLP